MSCLVNSDVNIFPVTNQRAADSEAHYLNEPHLVTWLMQLVDKKSFVVSQDETITVGEQSEQYFEFFIDGYYLAVKKRAIENWITSNSSPNAPDNIYAFLNIYDNYVLGDEIVATGELANFQGLELTTNPDSVPTVQLDSDPEPDTNKSTLLHILEKQSAGTYIVPKASKLKFDSYSINVDGGEV